MRLTIDLLKMKALTRGLATFLPIIPNTRGTGGTNEALYCYGVWLRHLVNLRDAVGLDHAPQTVAELGPGDSLGIGLMSLLTGSSRYVALDQVPFASIERNLVVFDQLVQLVRERHPIPGPDVYPNTRPAVADYSFPSWLLWHGALDDALSKQRLESLRLSLTRVGMSGNPIEYHAPWNSDVVGPEGQFDLIFSQAVLEHVDDLAGTYLALHRGLRPGGVVSHQIDFSCHGLSDEWNGHWSYGDLAWSVTRGRRPFLINRQSHSRHLTLLSQVGFKIIIDQREERLDGLARHRLARHFVDLSETDLTTKGAYIIGVKAAH